jgi:hypothetical protein
MEPPPYSNANPPNLLVAQVALVAASRLVLFKVIPPQGTTTFEAVFVELAVVSPLIFREPNKRLVNAFVVYVSLELPCPLYPPGPHKIAVLPPSGLNTPYCKFKVIAVST